MPRVRKPPPSAAVQMQPGSNQQLPATAPTGMPYGEHAASIEAQQAMPMGTGAPQVGPALDGAGLPPIDFDSVLGLDAETEFPDEPITAGLPIGPGAGPDAMVRPSAGRVSATLDMLAGVSGDETVRMLAEIAKAQGV